MILQAQNTDERAVWRKAWLTRACKGDSGQALDNRARSLQFHLYHHNTAFASLASLAIGLAQPCVGKPDGIVEVEVKSKVPTPV